MEMGIGFIAVVALSAFIFYGASDAFFPRRRVMATLIYTLILSAAIYYQKVYQSDEAICRRQVAANHLETYRECIKSRGDWSEIMSEQWNEERQARD